MKIALSAKYFEDNSKVKQLVVTPGNGKVLVVDGGGSKRHALLGDMLAEQAAQNGWEGFIINGCIRDDIDEMRQTPLGVLAWQYCAIWCNFRLNYPHCI